MAFAGDGKMSGLPDALNSGHEATVGPVVAVKALGPHPSEVTRALEEAKGITRQAFSGKFTCIEREDSEIVGDRYFVFRVVDDGEIGEVLARDDAWHRRIATLPADVVGLFRLSIEASQ